MNQDRFEGNWKQFGGKVKERWGRPTTSPFADFCAAFSEPFGSLSPNCPTTAQITPGKFDRLHHTPARFTTPPLDGYGLRNHMFARGGR